MSDHSAKTFRIPGEVISEIQPLAQQMSRAGVEVPWTRVALAALKRGTRALREELAAAPPPRREDA